jgi:hypothetical protein
MKTYKRIVPICRVCPLSNRIYYQDYELNLTLSGVIKFEIKQLFEIVISFIIPATIFILALTN